MKSIYPFLALVYVTTLALPSTTASAQLTQLFGGRSSVPTVSVDELKSMLERQRRDEQAAQEQGTERPKPDFVLVDVRSDAEINVSVIPGAISKAEYEKNAGQYRDRTVIAYCTIGGRSGRYAQQLKKKGVKTKNFKGSILEWVKEGLPLVTLDGKATNRVHTYSDRYRVPAQYEAVTE